MRPTAGDVSNPIALWRPAGKESRRVAYASQVRTVCVDRIKQTSLCAFAFGTEADVFAVGQPRSEDVIPGAVTDSCFMCAVTIDNIDLIFGRALPVRIEDDLPAVRRKLRATVVTLTVRDPLLVRAVSVHHIDLRSFIAVAF